MRRAKHFCHVIWVRDDGIGGGCDLLLEERLRDILLYMILN